MPETDVAGLIARLREEAVHDEAEQGFANAMLQEAAALIERQQRQIAELDAEIARLTGRMCLICGKPEPCSESPDACTFDPNPIDAAREFLHRATRAEEQAAALRKAAKALRDRIDERDTHLAEVLPAIDAAIDAALKDGNG